MSVAGSISPASCPRCQRVLGELPANARFCPKCGAGLPTATEPAKPTLHERLEQMQSLLHGHLTSENGPTPSVDQLHSLMLLGYANAMLQLGWRYEHGNGVARNSSEAERCYTKSAKLGNVYARSRLGDQSIDVSVEDAVPAERIVEPPPLPAPGS